MNETCPICENPYTEKHYKLEYHVEYKPEITIDACSGCNFAEYLMRYPDKQINYPWMTNRIKTVEAWTKKQLPLIS